MQCIIREDKTTLRNALVHFIQTKAATDPSREVQSPDSLIDAHSATYMSEYQTNLLERDDPNNLDFSEELLP